MKIKKHLKRLSGLMSLCIILGLMPMTALADAPTQVVSVDVGGANYDDANYRITDAHIWLKRTDVIYELSGSTDKPIKLWTPGSSADDAQERCHMRLNNVTVNGGIETVTVPVGIVIDVPTGTTNTFGRITVNNLSISGGGTLNTGSVHVDFHESPMPCGVNIVDTTLIIQNAAGLSCNWEGDIVLGGNADVTITGNGTHSVLNVGQSNAASMVLQDNASLKCLQDNIDTPASYRVSGLCMFKNSSLLLKDGSYLETKGKNSSTGDKGYGLNSNGNVTVQDNATLKTTGYDYALIAGNMVMNGGTVIADSKESLGIYASGTISISNGANVTASGNSPAIQSGNGITISRSTVNAESTIASAIYSLADVTITDSIVEAKGADALMGIRSDGTASVSGSWIHTSGNENFENHIENSVLINKMAGIVIGDPTLPGNATIPADTTLTFPDDTSLTVPAGVTLTIRGTIDGNFDITNNGTVICNGHVGGTATCVNKAVCEICGGEYGDLDPNNHDLAKIDAKIATHLAAGNIEHYTCNGCGKHFSDAAGSHELSQAEIIIPKTLAHTVDNTGLHADESRHWNTCACGIMLNKFDHTFKWIVDKEATENEKGEKHEECTVCGYKKAAVEIPASGTSPEPDNPGGNPADSNDPSDNPGNSDNPDGNPGSSDNPGGNPDNSGNQGGSGKPGNTSGQGGTNGTWNTSGTNNVQTQSGTSHTPQTGDGGKLVSWIALLLVSGTVLPYSYKRKHKRY